MKIPGIKPVLKIVIGHAFVKEHGGMESQKIVKTNTATNRPVIVGTILRPYDVDDDYEYSRKYYGCIINIQNAIADSISGTFYNPVRQK